ncbi:MAG: acyl carrier protein [Myxococcales bacterium]|nr:acyl carrier protein [Myxococcales bacterium]
MQDTSVHSLVDYICNYLATALELPPDTLGPDSDLERLGIPSSVVMALVGELEDRLGMEIAPTAFFDAQDVLELAQGLVAERR